MIDERTIEETLDGLIAQYESVPDLFYKSYIALPVDIYKEIERLSMSKSTLHIRICKKARKVADTYHRSIT